MLAMKKLTMLQNRWFAFVHDVLWVPVALFLAYWFRFNLGEIPPGYVDSLELCALVALPVQAGVFWYFDLYKGIWRYASLPDLLRILKAVAIGVVLTFALIFIWQRLANFPRSVLLLYPIILTMGLAGPRLLYRWFKDRRLDLTGLERKRALVIGAGRAGELLVRDLLKDGPYEPLGFLDDDRRKHGQDIHGVPVIGSVAELERVLQSFDIEVVLLAMPTASKRLVQGVVQQCQKADTACRTLPSVADLAGGRVEVSSLRKVEIEDLLGRDVVTIANPAVEGLIAGCCVLVTGAGGSIGSELCRQIAANKPARLLLLDHGEYNLYRIDQELADSGCAIESILADIRDVGRMRWVFETFAPEIVFNAAAYKHVPLVESNPAEGIKVNILGTCQLADLAVEYRARKFVQISTDKAVNPTNVMGASKRAAEIYCQNLDSRSPGTAFVTTRFGNVLGSAGSVVPLFRRQIEAGGPVTVTHAEITRYFMTIPEAVSLILQAGSLGKGGEIFVLDMGEPIRIVDLAEQMIRLSGLEPGQDIEIKFTGLRPGEKLYEELFHESEPLVGTSHPKLMLSSSREMDWEQVQSLLSGLGEACAMRDIDRLYADLRRLVPEFVPTSEPSSGVSGGSSLH